MRLESVGGVLLDVHLSKSGTHRGTKYGTDLGRDNDDGQDRGRRASDLGL